MKKSIFDLYLDFISAIVPQIYLKTKKSLEVNPTAFMIETVSQM